MSTLPSTRALAAVENVVAPAAASELAGAVVVREIELARGVRPERPTAGQRAQVEFRLRADVQPLLSGPPSNAQIIDEAQRRLELRVSGDTVIAAEAVDFQTRLDDREGESWLAGTITFDWPRARLDSPLDDRGATITQTLQLRSVPENVRSNQVLVEVNVPTRNWTTMFAAAALLLLMGGLSLAYLYFIRSGRWRSAAPGPAADVPEKEGGAGGQRPGKETQEPGRRFVPDQPPVPAVPAELSLAIAEGNAMLVLGGGASAQAGLPAAERLLLAMIEELASMLPDGLTYVLGEDRPEEELGKLLTKLGGIPKVMDAIVSAVPRDELAAVISGILSKSQPTSTMHAALADLPWRGLISLTWDDFADRIFAMRRPRHLQPLRRFTRTEAAEVLAAVRAGERLLLRPLGDLQRPHSLSLSIEEFRRNMIRAPDFPRAMGALLQSHCFLFLGVGTDTLEPFLQTIAADLEASELRHFALLPDDQTNDVWAPTLARFGVRILSYRPDSALATFATNLSRDVKGRSSARSTAPRTTSSLSAQVITQVRLTDIGPFESLTLDFAPAEGSNQSWTVIFGGNGVGKSSILRAIALGLAGDDPGARRAAGRLLRTGAPDGVIELQIGGNPVKSLLIRDGGRVEILPSGHTPVQNGTALVLGFPALRGARAPDPGGPSPTGEVRGPEPADLLPLVNGEVDGRLADFKQWLINVLVQAGDGQARAIAMRDLLDRIISEIVPGQVQCLAPITGDFTIRVRTPEGEVPFDDLSQGMTSIFNWIGILTQRLFEICDKSEAPNLEPATVLVDEVDAHLHPEWQRRLVELTRTHFPNVQVIATSHSPLLAGALRPTEIVVLERNPETKAVERLANKIDTFGMASQDILTSAVFGMRTDRNPQVEALIKQYFSLFEKAVRTPEEDKELAALQRQLDRFNYGSPDPPGSVAEIHLEEDQIEVLRRTLAAPQPAPPGGVTNS